MKILATLLLLVGMVAGISFAVGLLLPDEWLLLSLDVDNVSIALVIISFYIAAGVLFLAAGKKMSVARVRQEKAGVVAFAFGVPHGILSNSRIAQIATEKAKTLNVPVFTQLDISIEDPEISVEFATEKLNSPPPTLRIARGAVQWAKRKRLTELWVVAAVPHLWRCIRDLEYAVREAKEDIAIHVCEGIRRFPEKEWFCSDSTQPRTCSRTSWEQRESILRLMPMLLYDIVAS